VINISSNVGDNCTVNELVCNGRSVNVSTYRGSLSNCYVPSIACSNSLKTNTCSVVELSCQGSSVCDVNSRSFLCRGPQTCLQTVNTTTCTCPIDRNGTDCSVPRSLNCSLDLLSPKPFCDNPYYQDTSDPKADLLDGDPACLVFSLQETAALKYEVDCVFTEPLGDIPPNILAANFSYYILNDNFAVSRPAIWAMRFKIFNFNMLSDSGATTTVVLDKNQMEGDTSLWFNVTLAAIPDKYWSGNRLYAEVAWVQDFLPGGAIQDMLDRRFLDSPDYQGKGTEETPSNVSTILIAVFVPAGFIAIVTIYCVLKQKGYIS